MPSRAFARLAMRDMRALGGRLVRAPSIKIALEAAAELRELVALIEEEQKPPPPAPAPAFHDECPTKPPTKVSAMGTPFSMFDGLPHVPRRPPPAWRRMDLAT